MRRRITMEQFAKTCEVYCDVCDRCYSITYMDRHHRTRKHKHSLLILENVPQIHPSATEG